MESKYVPGRVNKQFNMLIRTIARVTRVDDSADKLRIFGVLPSWNPKEEITFPVERMPIGLLEVIEPDYRFVAYSNLGAENKNDLYLCDFEFIPGETLKAQNKRLGDFENILLKK